jgi:hypothetical protein
VICKTKEKKKRGESNTQVKRESKAKNTTTHSIVETATQNAKKCQNEMMLTQTQTSQRYHSDRLHQLNRCVQLSIRVLSAYMCLTYLTF